MTKSANFRSGVHLVLVVLGLCTEGWTMTRAIFRNMADHHAASKPSLLFRKHVHGGQCVTRWSPKIDGLAPA